MAAVRKAEAVTHHPGRRADGPELFEQPFVAQRVHRLPKAVVTEARELAVASEAAERRVLEHRLVEWKYSLMTSWRQTSALTNSSKPALEEM
jgi:hypothetical protein